MKTFNLRVLLFLFPLLIGMGIPSVYLYLSEENFRELDDLILSDREHVIGYAYNQENYNYIKWRRIVSGDYSRVVSLGSSRVLQFREQMFTVSFYNGGYTIDHLPEFLLFLQSLPEEKLPEYLILGLDQWMFSDDREYYDMEFSKDDWKRAFNKYPSLYIMDDIYRDILDSKYGLKDFLPKGDGIIRVGLNAHVNNKGFRNDGSMLYGTQIGKLLRGDSTAADYRFASTLARIREGSTRFSHSRVPNKKTAATLAHLLEYCKRKNIRVTAFLPPFADEVYDAMMASGNYDYMKGILPLIRPVFEAYEYELYDFSRFSDAGAEDREAIDGFHGSELTYGKLLLQMLKSGSVLNEVTDRNRLERDIDNSVNRYSIYGNDMEF